MGSCSLKVPVSAAPGQHHVEAIAGVELMDAAKRPQRLVAANVQVKVMPTPCLHGQPPGGCLRRGAPPRVELNPKPDRAIKDDRRADQLLAPGGHIVAQIGAWAQSQRIRDRHQSGRTPQLGHEDRGIGLVALTGLDHLVRRDGKRAAPSIVEQAAKQRFGVKAGRHSHGTLPSRPTSADVVPSPIKPMSSSPR
jgi:hypothetical protein